MAKQQRFHPHEEVEGQERKQGADRSRCHSENLLDVMLICGKTVLSAAGSASYAAN